jgi:hypothetical protein
MQIELGRKLPNVGDAEPRPLSERSISSHRSNKLPLLTSIQVGKLVICLKKERL